MAKRIEGLDPGMPAGEAAAIILEAKAAKMFELEDAAASGTDMEAVHDMRVASRRLRASMQVFEPLYRRKSFRRWYDMGRGVTKSLGRVRDADVFIDAFERLARKHAVTDGQRLAIAYIVGHRQGERMADVTRLNKRLAKMDLAGSRRGFSKFVHDDRKSSAMKAPLSDLAGDTVPERLESVLGHLPAALVPENAAAQHAMRIEFKRLRYAIETLSACFDERLDEILAILKDFQDALGELHDYDVFIGIVRAVEETSDARAAGVKDAYLEGVLDLLEQERRKRFGRFRSLMRTNGQRKLRSLILGSLAQGSGAIDVPHTGRGSAASEPEVEHVPEPEAETAVAEAVQPGTANRTAPAYLPERRRARTRERADMPIPEESGPTKTPPLAESP